VELRAARHGRPTTVRCWPPPRCACAAADWDRCINTSERTQRADRPARSATRCPSASRSLARARAAGLDPADVYGLIRQESRFISDAAFGRRRLRPDAGDAGHRTLDGAQDRPGLQPGALNDLDFNLRIGMAYLRRVLDDFGGALPLAAAAYNAGPGRPRRWREGPPLDAAAWAENDSLQRNTRLREEGAGQRHRLRAAAGQRHRTPGCASAWVHRSDRAPRRSRHRRGASMNVLVLGGSGFIGRALLEQLQRAGHRATVPTRRPHACRALTQCADRRRWWAATCSARPACWSACCPGTTRWSTWSPSCRAARPLRTIARAAGRTGWAAACVAAGVPRLVHVSALGVAVEAGALPSRYLRSKARGELTLQRLAGLR
jgi:hypothetical protein